MPHESNTACYGTNSILLIDHSAFADMDLPDYVRAVYTTQLLRNQVDHHLSSSFTFPPLHFFSVLLLFQNGTDEAWIWTLSSSLHPALPSLYPLPLWYIHSSLFTASHLWLPTTFYSCAVTHELLCCTWKLTAGILGWLLFKFASSAKSFPS